MKKQTIIVIIYYLLATVLFADMIDSWVSGGVYNLLAGLIIAFVLHSLWKLVNKEKNKK